MEKNHEAYLAYLRGPIWAEKRYWKFRLAKFRCERCSNKNRKLEVHHKTYRNLFNEPMEDLELLCCDCHQWKHGLSDFDPTRYYDWDEVIAEIKKIR